MQKACIVNDLYLKSLAPMLMLGNQDPNTLGPLIFQYLKEEMDVVSHFDRKLNYEPLVIERVWRRITRTFRVHRKNKRLLAMINTGRFRSLWVFKGMDLFPRTISQIKRQGVRLFNYNADHPLEHQFAGSGNQNVIESYRDYDAHFTYSQEIRRQLLEFCPSIPVFVVPFGHDVSRQLFDELNREEEVLRCCFIGNPDTERAKALRELNDSGIELDVFGANWKDFLQPSGSLRIFGQVVGKEYYRVLRRYRVQLNLFREHNRDSHNMRSFEAPSVGGVMLAPRTSEHSGFFQEGRDAFFFSTIPEAVTVSKSLLAMPKTEVDAIRKSARQRCESSGYSYRDRSLQILRSMKSIVEPQA